jgi:hypothetical protein
MRAWFNRRRLKRPLRLRKSNKRLRRPPRERPRTHPPPECSNLPITPLKASTCRTSKPIFRLIYKQRLTLALPRMKSWPL